MLKAVLRRVGAENIGIVHQGPTASTIPIQMILAHASIPLLHNREILSKAFLHYTTFKFCILEIEIGKCSFFIH